MTEESKSIPKWILVVSGLFAMLGVIVSLTLLFSPESSLKTVDISGKGVGYLIQMWAVRQFTVGFIFTFATLKKSISMLTLSYIFFLVMNIGDFFVGISQNDSSLYIGALVMCIISSTMIFFINRTTE
ncbi:MAG: hypothetical protein SFU98_11300 [Leptospiraceae bacterium]|nr:hypothetical protein [Leptospiraceae bacterium]